MGYSKIQSANALTHVDSIQEAIELMIQQHDKSVSPKAFHLHQVQHQISPLSRSGNKKTAPKVEGLFGTGFKPAKDEEEKWQCCRDYGFLCMVMAYARRRMPTLNNFCVNCDRPHLFSTSGSMLKPAVCSRELCVWAFQQLGVGTEAANEIATEAEVVDLLVCMAKFCVRGARREVIFDPYPQVYDPENPRKLVLDPSSKNWTYLQSLIESIPPVQSMTTENMKSNLQKTDRLVYPMLQWIISSNRSHMVQIPTGFNVKGMVTPYQYLLLTDSPEKEEKFKKAKKQYGTVFAFHGSAIENWHGIMRKGLLNATGSKLQVNGAAYGSGIYLSPAASTSFGYCNMGNYQLGPTPQKHRFLDTSVSLGCIAICEVVDKDIKKSADIWVHPHEDMVCTRFFFVYPEQKVGNATSFRTDNPAHAKELLDCLDYYK